MVTIVMERRLGSVLSTSVTIEATRISTALRSSKRVMASTPAKAVCRRDPSGTSFIPHTVMVTAVTVTVARSARASASSPPRSSTSLPKWHEAGHQGMTCDKMTGVGRGAM